MGWDEKAKDEARETYFSAVPTAVQTRMVPPFVEGARWQRDQLRTDEAIERVARALYLSVRGLPGDLVDAVDMDELGTAEKFRQEARAAITALLGRADGADNPR